MQMGWGSELMQNETTFLVLDGAMILIAVLTLTIFHPYFYFPFISKKGDKKSKTDEAGGGVTSGNTTTTDVEESGASETKVVQ
jgi:hypothetical protein